MARVLVTEKIASSGLDALRAAGYEVDVALALSPDELLNRIGGAHAIIIRSATQVTAEVIEAGRDLVVIGRAGIGLDNVDVDAATRQGVMVVNAPQSNVVSAAEHTIALLLAQARNIPQAHAALRDGRWERSHWQGVELAEKTLGIVGFGRIGKLVAERARGLQMRVIAADPFVSAEVVRQSGAELVLLKDLMAESDFVTVHLPKNAETTGLIDRSLLSLAKPTMRLINVARGGIVDEHDLAECLKDGIIAGAALDVFAAEPILESPLFGLDSVVVTPHLGASTHEAQHKAGTGIVEMVKLALAGEVVPWAVNLSATEVSETVRPFVPLAETLGRIFGSFIERAPSTLTVACEGEIASDDTRIIGLAVTKGILARTRDEPVSYVNAPQLAHQQGMSLAMTATTASDNYVNLIRVSDGESHSVAGTLVGRSGEFRVVEINGHGIDMPSADHLVVITNDNRPGVIGRVGTVLGEAGINIDDMDVGRLNTNGSDTAMMVLSTSDPVADETAAALAQAPGVLSVNVIES